MRGRCGLSLRAVLFGRNLHFRADRVAHACSDVHPHHAADARTDDSADACADERSVAHAICRAIKRANGYPHQSAKFRTQRRTAPGTDVAPVACATAGAFGFANVRADPRTAACADRRADRRADHGALAGADANAVKCPDQRALAHADARAHAKADRGDVPQRRSRRL